MADGTVIGLDLSLTSTGLAVIAGNGMVRLETIKSKGSKDADLTARWQRLVKLRGEIMLRVQHELPDLVVIEGPSYGQARQGGQHDRAGLWWLVVDSLAFPIPIAEVPPATRARYATGKGTASKDAVLAAVVRRYMPTQVDDNNQADALALAAMGARHLGCPIEASLPQAHLAAMDAVRWPIKQGWT